MQPGFQRWGWWRRWRTASWLGCWLTRFSISVFLVSCIFCSPYFLNCKNLHIFWYFCIFCIPIFLCFYTFWYFCIFCISVFFVFLYFWYVCIFCILVFLGIPVFFVFMYLLYSCICCTPVFVVFLYYRLYWLNFNEAVATRTGLVALPGIQNYVHLTFWSSIILTTSQVLKMVVLKVSHLSREQW